MENSDNYLLESLLESSDLSQTSSPTSSSSSGATSYTKHQKNNNFIGIIQSYSQADYKRHFRVRRSTAIELIGRYSHSDIFQAKTTNPAGCRKIGADEEVYMFLWYIANTEPYRTLANMFGVSNSTAWKTIDRVAKFIISIGHFYIKWPTNFEATSQSFESMAGVPGVVGAIDCTDIRIRAPSANKEDYYNRKKFYSLKLQAVVNAEKLFVDINVGEPGSLHDSRALRRSALFHKIQENGPFFGERNFILGDSAYPCTNWLVTPYKDNGRLTRGQNRFNARLSATRVVVENAFGLLKGRFRRIQFFTEHRSLNIVVNLITAACILHNICIMSTDEDVVDNNNNEVTQSQHEARDDVQIDLDEEQANVDNNNEVMQIQHNIRDSLYLQMDHLNLL